MFLAAGLLPVQVDGGVPNRYDKVGGYFVAFQPPQQGDFCRQLQHGRLHHILRVLAVAQHLQRLAVEQAVMGIVEIRKEGGIIRPILKDE